MLKKACRIVGNTVLVVSALATVWLVASWADVVLHNLDTNPVYHSWNLFVLMTQGWQQVRLLPYTYQVAYANGRPTP